MFQRDPRDPFYDASPSIDVDGTVDKLVNKTEPGRMRAAMARLAHSYDASQKSRNEISETSLSKKAIEAILYYGFLEFMPSVKSGAFLWFLQITEPAWILPFIILWLLPVALIIYFSLAGCYLLEELFSELKR